ncbi:MAG: hypothetical protein JNM56_00125, partial [Planctomycetia bacterium]|nr:hypothetical protein [Planctomycetia bacterium]
MNIPFLDHIGVRLLVSFYVALWLTILAHRLALALTARCLGFDVTSVGIGRARPLIVARW